ncbi:hypothetical protein E2C01_093784 [Portunus trituberculatus]|uniref:Uncharacterized protein n=1 Tax=Portunus trituberculatus TaxID=210409 RepID=A0A5B7K1B2_PORTR|nr:hypothetical protein [Portunus trituberculatus]
MRPSTERLSTTRSLARNSTWLHYFPLLRLCVEGVEVAIMPRSFEAATCRGATGGAYLARSRLTSR